MQEFGKNWSNAWSERRFRIGLIVTLSVLGFLFFIIADFFSFIQSRSGKLLNDFILNVFTPQDVSWFTFSIIYLALILALIYLSDKPKLLLLGLQSYCIIVIIRIGTIYFFPLEPPKGIIPLTDPFVTNLFYRYREITKDLFFSGHTSTMFLLALIVRNRPLKIFFILSTFAVGFLLIIQHVHYTIDILPAGIFSWLGYRIARIVN